MEPEAGEGAAHRWLEGELARLVGARIDAVYLTAETGLVALSVYAGEKCLLGAGIGPHANGVGWLPRAPHVRSGTSHALVAAMRAHLVGHRVRDVLVDDEEMLWVSAGGEQIASRIGFRLGRRGEACLIGPSGPVVRWPPGAVREGGVPRPLLPCDLAAAGARLVEQSDEIALDLAKAALLRAVRARLKVFARRTAAVQGDLGRVEDIDRLQRVGRMLLAQGSRIPRGVRSATLEDWEAGGTVEVALDPARPAKVQAEAFFAKARRYQRGEAVMRRRLEETTRLAGSLERLEAEIAAAPPEMALLGDLAARAGRSGVSSAPGALSGVRGEKQKPRRPYQVFRSAGGRLILVGRSAADNDALTTRHARPHDLWLHAKGQAGAHVVVPLEKSESCPPDVLADAATLAVHFSDARGEGVAEVSYAERRYVRKLRKSAPGTVVLDREKVIAVRIEPDRVSRLLASKEEG